MQQPVEGIGAGRLAGRLMLSVLGGLALALGALWLSHQLGWAGLYGTHVDVSARLQLVGGQGERTPDGLLVRRSAVRQPAVVLAPLPALPAERYKAVHWRIEGLQPSQRPVLIWSTRGDGTGKIERQLLPASRSARGRVDVSEHRGWRNRLDALGLVFPSGAGPTLIIEQLALVRGHGFFAEMTASLRAWLEPGSWDQRSINFRRVERQSRLLTPVTATAFWLGCSLLVFAVLSLRARPAHWVGGMATLILIAWLTLDVLWQWHLFGRLRETQALSAGLSLDARLRAAPDAALVPALDRLRERLPDTPARAVVLSDDPNGYLAGRVRYRLMPHNVLLRGTKLPSRTQMRAGDYLLLLGSPNDIRYDPKDGMLRQGRRRLAVALELEIPRLATLYQVKDR